jgi:hypothetical protein
MQLRLGLSQTSGYLAQQAVGLLALRSLGPVAAGQIGLATALMSAAVTVSVAPLQALAPEFGRLVARRDWTTLDARWARTATLSILMAAAGLGLLTILAVASGMSQSLVHLAPPAATAGLLAANQQLLQVTGAIAIYLRSHKHEPMLAVSLVGGVLVPIAVLVGGAAGGPVGFATGQLLVSLGVGIPMTWAQFRRTRSAHSY